MLQVRDFNGFRPMSSIDVDYTRDTESFSVYISGNQICRISHGIERNEYLIEVFDARLFAEHLERISHVLTLYAEH